MTKEIQDAIRQGQGELAAIRAQRLKDIQDGDVEVDPDLLDVGDEVAEEVVSEFKRAGGRFKAGYRLTESSGRPKGPSNSQPKLPEAEQRAACQRAMDIVLEQFISPTDAYAIVGKEVGVTGATIQRWARTYNLVPDPQNAMSASQMRGQTWDVLRRERLFDEMLDVAQMLMTRMKVWLTPESMRSPDSPAPPEDWNAANELKTIAVAAAVAHDKRTHIEDLKAQRGLRDVDSLELQNELSTGKQRLLEMGE